MGVRRIGKNLLLTLAGAKGPLGIWSHLGMTGKWSRRAAGEAPPRYSRLEIDLDDRSRIHYVDLRLFGRVRLVPGARFDELAELRALGPNPLVDGIDPAALHARLQRVKLPIKVAMLDQRLFAGVGNIQASEALFRARLDPRRRADALSRREVARLAAAVLASITFTLDSFGPVGATATSDTSRRGPAIPSSFTTVPARPVRTRRRGRAHPVISRIVQAGRATFFCPACQR